MTHIIDRLAAHGLVERVTNAEDGRSSPVALTKRGLAVVNQAVEAAVEDSPISAAIRTLTLDERHVLETLLVRLLHDLEKRD